MVAGKMELRLTYDRMRLRLACAAPGRLGQSGPDRG